MTILGLDLSTTTCGYAINTDGKIVNAGFFDISDVDTYKQKAEIIISGLVGKPVFDRIHVEETLANFMFGRTSQNTLLKLAMNKAVICYILEEKYSKKVFSYNVNTMRKFLFGNCRAKGVKSKDFVKHQLSNKVPYIKNFDVIKKVKGSDRWDDRNSDMYDAAVVALYEAH